MMMTRRALAAFFVLVLCACGDNSASAPLGDPPPEVMKALTRGVNLSTWFTERSAPDIDPQRWYADASDFKRIRALGLRHVRIPVDPAFLENPEQPGSFKAEALNELRQGITAAQAEGLMVVLALQPSSAVKQRLKADDGVQVLAGFWRALAGELAGYSPAKLVFEALNEPELEDPARSRAVMQRLVAAIREAAPRHTVVVAGHKFSDVEELLALKPLEAGNLIYAFHFYTPPNFTHQGANWGWPMWAKFAGWPYPSSPELVAPLLEHADPEAKEHLAWYGQQAWARPKLDALLDQAGAWAARNEVPIWCNEFGAIRGASPPDARRAWLQDVREGLEARRIPWTHWDYAGHFGLMSGKRGARLTDPEAVSALQLPR